MIFIFLMCATPPQGIHNQGVRKYLGVPNYMSESCLLRSINSSSLVIFIVSTVRLDSESLSHAWESDSEASLTVDTTKITKLDELQKYSRYS